MKQGYGFEQIISVGSQMTHERKKMIQGCKFEQIRSVGSQNDSWAQYKGIKNYVQLIFQAI